MKKSQTFRALGLLLVVVGFLVFGMYATGIFVDYFFVYGVASPVFILLGVIFIYRSYFIESNSTMNALLKTIAFLAPVLLIGFILMVMAAFSGANEIM